MMVLAEHLISDNNQYHGMTGAPTSREIRIASRHDDRLAVNGGWFRGGCRRSYYVFKAESRALSDHGCSRYYLHYIGYGGTHSFRMSILGNLLLGSQKLSQRKIHRHRQRSGHTQWSSGHSTQRPGLHETRKNLGRSSRGTLHFYSMADNILGRKVQDEREAESKAHAIWRRSPPMG